MSEAHLRLLYRLLVLIDGYGVTVTPVQIGADLEVWLKVRAALETAAQCVIDLALAMVARRHLGPPESYKQTFALLAQGGVISSELAQELQGWAGLRNVLAHVYTTLDLDVLHRALTDTSALHTFANLAAADLQLSGS